MSCRFPAIRRSRNAHIDRLEDAVEHYNAELPPLKEFILPGGTRAAALTHVARTICRRAERDVVALAAEDDSVSKPLRIYLNRLSDLLFVLARALNRSAGAPDVLWQKDRSRGTSGLMSAEGAKSGGRSQRSDFRCCSREWRWPTSARSRRSTG